MPRSVMTTVTWWRASGSSDQKSQRVAEEEDRRVVSDDVPVALVRIELQGESSDVALRVGGAALAGYGREAREHLGLLADLGEDAGLGVLGDVMCHGEGAEGSGTLGVHAPLGDDLAIEVRQFLKEPHILKERRASFPGGLNVLVVDDGGAERSGKFLHGVLSGAMVVGSLGFKDVRRIAWAGLRVLRVGGCESARGEGRTDQEF